jgi:uncharacterized lipoprotein YmbA
MARSKVQARAFGPLILAFGLASCATPAQVQVTCLPQANYSSEEQKSLRLAYDALPAGSLLRRALQDYLAMRDANRACKGGAP